MSLIVTTSKGQTMAQFTGYPISGVQIGECEMPLEDFCMMATHFLEGGLFGWAGETPKAVNNALSNLFEMYEQVDGKWVRKAQYSIDNKQEGVEVGAGAV